MLCHWHQSLPLVGITSFIMGLVLTLRLRPTMVQFGATSWIPVMVGLTIIQELGPIITGLMVAGKVGSSIGAELGSMRVSEQINAMEVLGINPFKYLVVKRILAATLMVPILTLLADAVGLGACYLRMRLQALHTFTGRLTFGEVLPAVAKTFFFGFAIGLVGCYKGYNADKGTEGVGVPANSAVVLSSLLIFLLDLVAVGVSTAFGLI
ncbi:ABC transporter permease [Hymenobacter arcticus]